MNIHFETIGCKLNQIETESIARAFSTQGFEPHFAKNADSAQIDNLAQIDDLGQSATTNTNNKIILCIVNTCTVTAKAEQKARRLIRLLLNKHQNAPVIVTGCYAQVEKSTIEQIDKRVIVVAGALKDSLVDLPMALKLFLAQNNFDAKNFTSANVANAKVDALCTFLRNWVASIKSAQEQTIFAQTQAKSAQTNFVQTKFAPAKINQLDATAQKAQKMQNLQITAPVAKPFRLSTDTFLNHSRASIKIQDGCNNFCSFCRICLARGKPISLDCNEVLARVRDIENAGQSEIVLTGVNLTLYKGKMAQNDGALEYYNFARLLDYLLANTKNVRFRISSLYPEHVNAVLLNVIKDERVQAHFHLSVQSGSNAILQAMNRRYTREDVLCAVQNLRAIKPNAFIACDIIAGFPSETEADFLQTVELVKSCNFTWVHAFPFSPRPNTKAYTMKPVIKESVRNERVATLTQIAIAQKNDYVKNCVGKSFFAIVEKRRTNPYRAVTENFLHVKIDGNADKLAKYAGCKVRLRLVEQVQSKGIVGEIDGVAVLA